MSHPIPDYYEMLGLTPLATPDEVKKRYRELAKRFHPDINPHPQAEGKIQIINEAYHTLGDIEKRANYDAKRILFHDSSRFVPMASRSNGSTPKEWKGKVEYNGFGRSAPTEWANPSPQPKSEASQKNEGSAAPPLSEAQSLIAEAKIAYINRQYVEAERLCMLALKANHRDAETHELMGDIYARKGNEERAGTAYSYAIQFQPYNERIQAKLEKLTGQRIHAASHVKMTQSPAETIASPLSEKTLHIAGGLAALCLVGILIIFGFRPGAPVSMSLFSLSMNLILALGIGGAMLGFLIALYGGQRPISELLEETDPSKPVNSVSRGAWIPVISLFWYYASFLYFLHFSMKQKSIFFSVLKQYGATLALLILFAALYHPNHLTHMTASTQTMLWGGNVLFPASLLGWLLGDMIRFRGRL